MRVCGGLATHSFFSMICFFFAGFRFLAARNCSFGGHAWSLVATAGHCSFHPIP
eukprot:NODE_5074_length_533_cov_67.946281_g3743_i0.p4 GENE.NODE_5074_length_533_cov_67.946281_g3743_i0~~NODE_5074_length_533_cov_67.946281_g3743_i0.p4  ORF type:complete len:54 (-),score=3.82 NODE_5074_length_533_cov_67.946281_g3743_i0:105-266(-)